MSENTAQDESELARVQNRDWIADLLGRVDFVAWDRFTVGEINDYQIVDVYGWIDRDDEYKDFVWSRFWPENENLEYTTSSDEYTKEIERIWFGEASAGHNPCRRVENTFDVDNAVVLDEPEPVTDGGEEVEAGADQIRSEVDHEDWMDISESELVDYVEGRTSFGLVFDHDEIGLHGLKFDPVTGVLEAVAYEVR